MCFPLHTRNDVDVDNLRAKWVPEIRYHCPGVPFILVGVIYPDKLPKRCHVKLGTKVREGEKLAEELGALKYLECDTVVTLAGVQEVLKEVSTALF